MNADGYNFGQCDLCICAHSFFDAPWSVICVQCTLISWWSRLKPHRSWAVARKVLGHTGGLCLSPAQVRQPQLSSLVQFRGLISSICAGWVITDFSHGVCIPKRDQFKSKNKQPLIEVKLQVLIFHLLTVRDGLCLATETLQRKATLDK